LQGVFGNTFSQNPTNLLLRTRTFRDSASARRNETISIETIAAFWAVSFLFVIMPGADWAYAITAGLRHRTVLPAMAGLLAGHLAATAIVAAGVAALMSRSSLTMALLTGAGAVYLVWLGIGTLRRPATIHAASEPRGESWLRQAGKGAAVSGLNPKLFLLFLALLPQFTNASAYWPVSVQILVLGLVHTASCGVVFTAVSTGARRLLRARPTAARAVSRFSGIALVGIGMLLLTEQAIG
jgi:threonine/homoserine/homoserine lactone efflux protein